MPNRYTPLTDHSRTFSTHDTCYRNAEPEQKARIVAALSTTSRQVNCVRAQRLVAVLARILRKSCSQRVFRRAAAVSKYSTHAALAAQMSCKTCAAHRSHAHVKGRSADSLQTLLCATALAQSPSLDLQIRAAWCGSCQFCGAAGSVAVRYSSRTHWAGNSVASAC